MTLVFYITVATRTNLFIVLPAVASAAYIAFSIAHLGDPEMTETSVPGSACPATDPFSAGADQCPLLFQ